MAKIYGIKGEQFDPKSKEGDILEALKKLPEGYHVIHSYKSRSLFEGKLDDSEADFLVFHPKYGFLVIEAKAGRVYRDDDGQWHYANGDDMKHDPFDQAFTNLYKISNRDNLPYGLENAAWARDSMAKAKFIPAVWLPSYTTNEIAHLFYGPSIIQDLILSKDDLSNPTLHIEKIMKQYQRIHVNYKIEEITDAGGYTHQLGETESLKLFKMAICPVLGLASNPSEDETEFIQLLEEQKLALDFLSEQKTAVISGAGGTGKTLLAVERARRVSAEGEKTLFLCYNFALCEELEQKHKKELPNVDFRTIDSFACWLYPAPKANYPLAKRELEGRILDDAFEYKHIVIDEGQDFGKENIEESNILDLLADYGQGGQGTTFYLFYDKNQTVQSKKIPKYILQSDSKITLYNNCRNTKRIASASLKPLEKEANCFEFAPEGERPWVTFYDQAKEAIHRVDNIIKDNPSNSKGKTVILTCKMIETTCLKSKIKKKGDKDYYFTDFGTKVPIYTIRTFKGLEADNVILVDVGSDFLDGQGRIDFYVGASRAKKRLFILAHINQTQAAAIMEKHFPDAIQKQDKLKALRLAMEWQ